MIADIQTVMWKEWRDLFGDLQRKSTLYKVGVVVVALFFATVLSLVSEEGWTSGETSLMFWLAFPFVFTSQMVADSFAGERERHTLETLLATRLPDRAIYIGKLLTPTLMVWVGVQAWMLYTLVPLNIAFGRDGLLLFSLETLLLGMSSSLALTLLISAIGTLGSLHAPTVQSAQVRIGIFTFIIFFLPIFAFALLLILPDNVRQQIVDFLTTLGVNRGIIAVTGIIFLTDVGLVILGMRLFRRSRMILD
ncbi:MAG: ABC transporter permease subunit [Aggregatilineales bacterium]